MAAPGSWFRTGTVTVTNGSDVVTGFGTAWRTSATPPEIGDIFTVDGKALYEVLAINSDESIKLRKPYEETTATKTAYAIIRNTSATINSRLAAGVTRALNQKQVMIDEQSQWLTSTNATESFTDPLGVAHPVMTPHAMEESVTNKVNEVDSRLNTIIQQNATTKAQWEALRQKCIRDGAGSGPGEWGKHFSNSTHTAINEGLFSNPAEANRLFMGSKDSGAQGVSRTGVPTLIACGVQFNIESVNRNADSSSYANAIALSDAPDGTKTRDSATGVVTAHGGAATAFAAETATNRVITSRKDLVGFKVQEEVDMDLYDVFFPNGSTQYGASTWNGIPLVDVTTLGVPQALCGFGEWDTATKGKGVKFSTLSDANKKKVLADPKNNIRYDAVKDKLVFSLIKAISIEGVGDTWENPRLGKYDSKAWLSSALDQDWSTTQDYQVVDNDPGRKDGTHSIFVPICLSGSLNKGLYSGEFNNNGSGCIGSGKYLVDYRPTSRADCFVNAENGSIASGKSGNPSQYKYHDARYAGMVEDLRLSSHVQDESKLLVDSINKVFNGTMRGKGKVPFTTFELASGSCLVTTSTAAAQGSSGWCLYISSDGRYRVYFDGKAQDNYADNVIFTDGTHNVYLQKFNTNTFSFDLSKKKPTDNNLGLPWPSGTIANMSIVKSEFLSPEFNSLPMVNIIGSIANAKATFKSGVIGGYINKTPDGSSSDYELTMPSSSDSTVRLYTKDNGASWVETTRNINKVTNNLDLPVAAVNVELHFYESPSSPTESANNSPVIGDVGCVIATEDSRLDYGNRLLNSLTGLIGKDAASSSDTSSQRLPLLSYGLTPNGVLGDISTGEIKHGDLTLGAPSNNSPGSKCLFTLAEINGLLTLQAMGNALAHDGTDWGDDGKITPVDGEGTKTNDNGIEVKTFCHHLKIPLGIASYNNSSQAKE